MTPPADDICHGVARGNLEDAYARAWPRPARTAETGAGIPVAGCPRPVRQPVTSSGQRKHSNTPDMRGNLVASVTRESTHPEATTGSAGAGEGARHRRARVPTAEARVGAKERAERRLFECFRWPELVTGCLTGPGRPCRGMPASISACPGRAEAGPVRVHRRGCLGPCRDRCHPQVVSSGNGAVTHVPTTVETHGTRSQRHQTRPGTGEHHDQELSSRRDEGLRCRP